MIGTQAADMHAHISKASGTAALGSRTAGGGGIQILSAIRTAGLVFIRCRSNIALVRGATISRTGALGGTIQFSLRSPPMLRATIAGCPPTATMLAASLTHTTGSARPSSAAITTSLELAAEKSLSSGAPICICARGTHSSLAAQEMQIDCTPNCPESALSSRCRSGEDLLVVCLRPIQESAFLRWIAQGNRYCAGCLDSGKDGQNLLLRLQTIKNRTALRRQPPETVSVCAKPIPAGAGYLSLRGASQKRRKRRKRSFRRTRFGAAAKPEEAAKQSRKRLRHLDSFAALAQTAKLGGELTGFNDKDMVPALP